MEGNGGSSDFRRHKDVNVKKYSRVTKSQHVEDNATITPLLCAFAVEIRATTDMGGRRSPTARRSQPHRTCPGKPTRQKRVYHPGSLPPRTADGDRKQRQRPVARSGNRLCHTGPSPGKDRSPDPDRTETGSPSAASRPKRTDSGRDRRRGCERKWERAETGHQGDGRGSGSGGCNRLWRPPRRFGSWAP